MADDRLFPASFRGVPFGIKSSRRAIGRRNVIHEFVQRDDPYVEDLGRLPRRFTLEAFVVGRDWKSRAEALETALEEKGPGTLVHPWAGEVLVSLAGEVSISEGVDVGTLHVVFSIPFVKDSVPDSPAPSPNMTARVSRAASLASLASGSCLDQYLTLAGQGSQVLDAVQGTIQNVMGKVRAVMNGDLSALVMELSAADLVPPATLTSLLAAGDLGQTLFSRIGSLAATFKGISGLGSCNWVYEYGGSGGSSGVSATSGGSSGVSATSGGSSSVSGTAVAREQAALARQKAQAFLRLAAMAEDPVSIAASTVGTEAGASVAAATFRSVTAANAAAFARMEREAAVVETAKALARAVPESRSESVAMRREFIEAVEAVMERTPSDAVYETFVDLRDATVAVIAENARQSPDIVSIETAVSLPALVLCHRHSRGIDLEADLVTRNRVHHPGFVPAGSLEVMKNG